MGRPSKEQDDDTPVSRNGVPYLNTDENTGSTDNVELGESNQSELGFDEPAVLGVNAIVVEDEPDYASDDAVTDSALITDEDDPQPRDNLELITNSDGTLQRANAV